MQTSIRLPFITLLLMISFASINAVLFTPALPVIANFFAISPNEAQQTITWFLVGYAIGQLFYGPLANRLGRIPALYFGILLQIFSSLLCVFSGFIHLYSILVLGRFLLALGSGVGLKMTFTLVSETQEPSAASQTLSYLMIAFAITPGLGVMLGGLLTSYFGWTSTFYAGATYGVILFLLVTQLPETKTTLNFNALKFNHLIKAYGSQFKNFQLITGGLLMGGATCFVYLFAALAPFIAISLLHMNEATYGIANLLPPIGLMAGSLFAAQLTKKWVHLYIIQLGIFITLFGSIIMFLFAFTNISIVFTLFVPMMICYFGISLVYANASIIALKNVSDKAHGSAVMNFINMGSATLVVLLLSFLKTNIFLLSLIYIFISLVMMIFLYKSIKAINLQR